MKIFRQRHKRKLMKNRYGHVFELMVYKCKNRQHPIHIAKALIPLSLKEKIYYEENYLKYNGKCTKLSEYNSTKDKIFNKLSDYKEKGES